MSDVPEVHFGSVKDDPPNWRDAPDNDDPDDEVLAKTPPEIVAMLGFDPLDYQDEGDPEPARADSAGPIADAAIAAGVTVAAGVILITPDRKVLLLKRSDASDHPGEWCLPGGKLEKDESLEECIEREMREEIGVLPKGQKAILTRMIRDGVDYTTFLQSVEAEFEPKLDDEHSNWAWVGLDKALAAESRADDMGFEEKHPRVPAGGPTAGEFARKSEGGVSGTEPGPASSPAPSSVAGGAFKGQDRSGGEGGEGVSEPHAGASAGGDQRPLSSPAVSHPHSFNADQVASYKARDIDCPLAKMGESWQSLFRKSG